MGDEGARLGLTAQLFARGAVKHQCLISELQASACSRLAPENLFSAVIPERNSLDPC